MLSRVADCAYWMSRYLERAEHTARLGDVCLGLTLDRSSDTVRRLMCAVGTAPSGYGVAITPIGEAAPEVRLNQTIEACVAAARENARQVREQISTEMWEQLNRLYLRVLRRRMPRGAAAFYMEVKEAAHLFHGVTESTMIHSEGWHYIQIGRSIERAAATATMLEAHFDDTEGAVRDGGISAYVSWSALLRSCSGFEAYCQRYTADVRPERVAEFLLLNADFPRSVRFAIDGVEASLRSVSRALGRNTPGRVDRLAGRLRASLDYSQIDEIMAESLQSYVQGIRRQCEQVHTALYETYISYPTEAAIGS
jgi:uncharacterized alpha-E superfamily protein